jgi:hypothetical protein
MSGTGRHSLRTALLAILLIGVASGQSGLRMFGGRAHMQLALPAGKLQVAFTNVGPSQDWVLAVAVDPTGGSPEFFRCWRLPRPTRDGKYKEAEQRAPFARTHGVFAVAWVDIPGYGIA